jgi:ankyrin repeat protein
LKRLDLISNDKIIEIGNVTLYDKKKKLKLKKMDKIYKEIKRAQITSQVDIEPLSDLLAPPSLLQQQTIFQKDRQLSIEEKKYLLAAERGDIATVKFYLNQANNFEKFDMNVVDPLGRSALHIAIEYENIEMIEVLLNYHVDVGEALLHAINEEFVEAVEMLLHYQDSSTPVEVSIAKYLHYQLKAI